MREPVLLGNSCAVIRVILLCSWKGKIAIPLMLTPALCLFAWLCLPVCLSLCLHACLPVFLFLCLSVDRMISKSW